jgi:protein transport protein HofC
MFFRLLRLALFTLFWSLLVCLVVLVILNFTDRDAGPTPLPVFIALMLIAIGATLVWFFEWKILRKSLDFFPISFEPRRRRQREGFAVLAYVEQAIRMNAPLSPILEAAARSETGRLTRRLNGVRELLDGGVDLATALEQEVPEISGRAIGLIAVGEKNGQLRTALTRLLAEAEPQLMTTDYDARFAQAYIIMMLMTLVIALLMIGNFVEPKFKDIMRDFHMPLPAINQWVLAIGGAAIPALVIAAVGIMVLWLSYGIWMTIQQPRHLPRDLWGLFAFWASQLPGIGASARDRSWADVSQVLADSFAAGWPADAALGYAQELALFPKVRRSVRRWNEYLVSGVPFAEGAARAGVPAIFVGILSSAGSESAAALNFLAGYYANRFSRLRILLRGALVPAAVIFFALCVTAVALSTFIPIVELINHMAAWVGGIR